MITIATFSFPFEAHIARARLEADGIPAFIANEYTISMNWLYSNALGGIEVQVPDAFADQARAVLLVDYSQILIDQEGEDQLLCLSCGSAHTELITKGRRIALSMVLVFSCPLWKIKKQIHCLECGAKHDYDID